MPKVEAMSFDIGARTERPLLARQASCAHHRAMDRNSPSTDRAVARAFWLAELSAALEQAGKLTLVLTSAGIEESEMVELRARIVSLRVAVGRLQNGEQDSSGEVPLHDLL